MVSSESTNEVKEMSHTNDGADDIIKNPLKHIDLFTYMKSQQITSEDERNEIITQEAKKGAVLAWHYSMVNDVRRNEQYYSAIKKVVNENTIVLDIGTGAGLLALISARCGAKHVYTVEFEPTLAALAQEIIKDNGLEDKITVLNMLSTEMEIGVHMPEKADVLVSEIVDSLLIGEHMIPTYLHAVNNLVKENGHIMPVTGHVMVLPIESDTIRHDRSVENGKAEGFDFTLVNQLASKVVNKAVRVSDITYRQLADTQLGWSWDFRDKKGYKWPKFGSIDFTILSDGVLDAVLLYFDMYLDANIVVSTEPNVGWAHEQHWVQYAFTFAPIAVKAGDTVRFLIGAHETHIQGDLLYVNGKPPVFMDVPPLKAGDRLYDEFVVQLKVEEEKTAKWIEEQKAKAKAGAAPQGQEQAKEAQKPQAHTEL